MRYERSDNASAPPLCASCAQTMRLARITSRFGDLPDLYVFECRACGVSHIEAGCIVADLEAENQATRVQTPALEKHHCRWPVEGADAETFFCGANKLGDSPYC